jgi:uncharacterized SAM-binding protein YcdF (DUF218 family)
MPPHVSERWRDYLGPGALPSLAVATVIAVACAGVPVAWRLGQVLATARRDQRRPVDAILVLGRTLERDRPSAVFAARLDHGARLFHQGLAPCILVTGGLTGDATRSEAEAGREHLLEAGVPSAAVHCEGRSRHTLENLYNAREAARRQGWRRLLVVSDPLHLARARAMATGLGLETWCSPAPGAGPGGGRGWLRAVREALLLHWYHTGVLYSRLTRNRRNLARVT